MPSDGMSLYFFEAQMEKLTCRTVLDTVSSMLFILAVKFHMCCDKKYVSFHPIWVAKSASWYMNDPL